ncbi:MAG: class II fructose-bisphosphate aldolase [Firmicutes bacterium]|nr:class II fructose-bisphosphate aldolase [Bacillota bacterium]
MPLVSPREMILRAQAGGYAAPAFNAENMEMAQAVMQAAEEMRAPVILQTTSSTLRYGGAGLYAAIAGALASDAAIPAALHLDHGESFALAVRAVRAGYTSVMIDGSRLAFADNVALTRGVAEMAAAVGLPAEGELGKVGGKEDDAESSGPALTDPDEAAEFARETGVFSLAIGIGTSHGVYKGKPALDMERISAVARKISNPLVLHGTSGVPDADVRECIRRGICKVNYATELRIAFTDGVRAALAEHPDAFDPKVYLKEGRRRVYEAAKAVIAVCGAEGKA